MEGDSAAADSDAGRLGKIARLGLGKPSTFAVTGNRLYWIDSTEQAMRHLRAAALPNGEPAGEVEVPGATVALAVLGEQAYIATSEGAVYVWRDGALQHVATVPGLTSALVSDGRELYAESLSGVWDLNLGESTGPRLVPGAEYLRVDGHGSLYWVRNGALVRSTEDVVSEIAAVESPLLHAVALTESGGVFLLLGGDLCRFNDTDGLECLGAVSGDGPLWLRGAEIFWLNARADSAISRWNAETMQEERVFASPGLLAEIASWQGRMLLADSQGFFWVYEPE